MKSPPYAQTGVKGQPEGCKLLKREATQRVLTHKLQLLAQIQRLHATQPDQINSTPVLGEVEETDCDQSTGEKVAPRGKTRGRRAGEPSSFAHLGKPGGL